jgi:hypothetical protein
MKTTNDPWSAISENPISGGAHRTSDGRRVWQSLCSGNDKSSLDRVKFHRRSDHATGRADAQ